MFYVFFIFYYSLNIVCNTMLYMILQYHWELILNQRILTVFEAKKKLNVSYLYLLLTSEHYFFLPKTGWFIKKIIILQIAYFLLFLVKLSKKVINSSFLELINESIAYFYKLLEMMIWKKIFKNWWWLKPDF